jgi:hypothetical protein
VSRHFDDLDAVLEFDALDDLWHWERRWRLCPGTGQSCSRPDSPVRQQARINTELLFARHIAEAMPSTVPASTFFRERGRALIEATRAIGARPCLVLASRYGLRASVHWDQVDFQTDVPGPRVTNRARCRNRQRSTNMLAPILTTISANASFHQSRQSFCHSVGTR